MSGPLPSPEWAKVRAWADGRIAETQALMESPLLGIDATQVHRGTLLALRKLIEWGEPTPAIAPVAFEPVDYNQ